MGCVVKKLVVIISMLISVVAGGSAFASPLLLGKTVGVAYYFNGAQHNLFTGQGNFVVGSGVETTLGVNSNNAFVPIFDVDLQDDIVTITSRISGDILTSSDGFNGIRFTDVLSQIPNFLSFVFLDGTLQSTGGLSNNEFSVNFTPRTIQTGDFVRFRLTAADGSNATPTVPVPAALPLFLSALAGGAFATRKKREAA